VCHLINRLPSSVIGGKTPIEVFFLEKLIKIMTRLGYLDVLPAITRAKVFLGFKRGVKGYKIWDLKDKKTILSRDVTFDEALMKNPTDSLASEE